MNSQRSFFSDDFSFCVSLSSVLARKIILALALVAGSASAGHYSPDEVSQKYLWKAFKAEHKKAYADDAEDARRFIIFVQNLRLIDARNQAETGSAVHGKTTITNT